MMENSTEVEGLGMEIIGQQIGKYRIERRIGQGGMADVYLAMDTQLEREVAFKIIRIEMFPPVELERILKRFKQEAKALAKMDHPNIIHVIDYGEYDNKPYLVMPYQPGGTLKDQLKGATPWQEAFRLMLPIVDAVGYAHKKEVLHRDIKTSNILIRENGAPLITDFGVAKILTDPDASISMTLAGIGTPNYMAPEQWIGKAEYASDQYSIGVMLYQMITGQLPFSAETPMAVMVRSTNDTLPPASSVISDLPVAVENLLIRMLMKDPKKRYGSLIDVHGEMEQLLLENPVARPRSKGSVMKNPEATIDEVVMGANSTGSTKRWDNKVMWIAIIALVFVIMAGVIIDQYIGLKKMADSNVANQAAAVVVDSTATVESAEVEVTESAPTEQAVPEPSVTVEAANPVATVANINPKGEILVFTGTGNKVIPVDFEFNAAIVEMTNIDGDLYLEFSDENAKLRMGAINNDEGTTNSVLLNAQPIKFIAVRCDGDWKFEIIPQ